MPSLNVKNHRRQNKREDRNAIIARVEADPVAAYWRAGVEARPKGNVAKALCPFHEDSDPSFHISLEDRPRFKMGKWTCRAGCGGGDLFDLVARQRGLSIKTDFAKVLADAATLLGISGNGASPMSTGKRKAKPDDWQPITPVPGDAPAPMFWRKDGKQPAQTWNYRDVKGRIVGYVCRFNHADGSKESVKPYSFCERGGKRRWQWKGLPRPHPIYNLDLLALHPDRPVLVVEGEKCADTAQAAVPEYVVVTWQGGDGQAKQAAKAGEFDPLKDRTVTIWPDNDPPGQEAARIVNGALDGTLLVVRIPENKTEGWDCADAVAEGMDLHAILATAQPAEWSNDVQSGGDDPQPNGGDPQPNGGDPKSVGAQGVSARAEQAGEESPRTKDSAPFQPEPQPDAKYSDIALSNAFAEGEDGNDLLYAPKLGAWFIYRETESRYAEDELMFVWTLVKRFLTRTANALVESMIRSAEKKHKKDSEEERKKAVAEARREGKKIARTLTNKAKVAAVLQLAMSHPRLATSDRSFDTDKWLLNTPGGVVDLTTGKMRKGTRADRFSKITKVAPKPMPTPIFDQFMLEIMGWKLLVEVCPCAACAASVGKPVAERNAAHQAEVRAMVAYLLRFYGYSLSADTHDHVLEFQIGPGGNGKGALNDLIARDVMGREPDGYSCLIPIQALLAPKGERHPTELTGLWHSRLALARESDEGVRWNEGRVKDLTGGDPVQARKMRQDFNKFESTHKLVVFGNSKPPLRGADQAAWKRRLHMVPFPQKWEDEADPDNYILEADKELPDKLAAEAPGILAKLIDGCLEYRKLKKLDPPLTVRAASRSYLAEFNVILRWLLERCDWSDTATQITANKLWTDFCQWGEINKEWIGKRTQFNEKLQAALIMAGTSIKVNRTGAARGICEGLTLKLPEPNS